MSEPPPYASPSSSSTSFFQNASGTTINGAVFAANYVATPDDSYKYLEPLYKLVAQNAILNQGGRPDQPRCSEGTRKEVIARIEQWRDGGYLRDRLILWLSGPAGAGKSAIIQTVAERCMKDLIPMINFFFFRSDSTRNHARPLIATLLFQLFDIFPSLKVLINAIIRENPVIFDASLAKQFETLVINPIMHLHRASPLAQPVVLLIDGLDECDPKADQSALLRLLHNLVDLPNSPFVVLVASRAESQITMTFNSIGTFHGSIFLDDSCRPSDDIRLYVRDELTQIRKTHTLVSSLGDEWPSEDDIDSIVRKSSGQFIYAATVVRFVSDPLKSPHASLQTVLGMRLPGKRTPFAEIDTLYTHMLSQVDDWDFVRKVFVLDRMARFKDFPPNIQEWTLWILNTNVEDLESSLIVLAPIIRFATQSSQRLHFYHASFNDFLRDKTRAGNFFLDEQAVSTQLIHMLIGKIGEMRSGRDSVLFSGILHNLLLQVTTPTDNLTLALQQITLVEAPSSPDNVFIHEVNMDGIFYTIYSIYDHVEETRAAILRSWVAWFRRTGIKKSRFWYADFWLDDSPSTLEVSHIDTAPGKASPEPEPEPAESRPASPLSPEESSGSSVREVPGSSAAPGQASPEPEPVPAEARPASPASPQPDVRFSGSSVRKVPGSPTAHCGPSPKPEPGTATPTSPPPSEGSLPPTFETAYNLTDPALPRLHSRSSSVELAITSAARANISAARLHPPPPLPRPQEPASVATDTTSNAPRPKRWWMFCCCFG